MLNEHPVHSYSNKTVLISGIFQIPKIGNSRCDVRREERERESTGELDVSTKEMHAQ